MKYTDSYILMFFLKIYQLLKNYLRMRRIEESKSNNNVLYELLDEFEDQDDGLAK